MRTRLSRTRSALAPLLATLLVLSCGSGKREQSEAKIPMLRFAGVDLEYALERVTTEADWVLALDEITSKTASPDLTFVRVDLDIPAGTLDDALRLLKSKTKAFDYQLADGVVYVRSNMLVDDKTSIDLPLLEGAKFHGDLGQLVRHIMNHHPGTFISTSYLAGQFKGGAVDLEIPPKASVKDALLLYARTAKAGWAMRRSGRLTKTDKGEVAVEATTIQPRGPRKTILRLPRNHNKLSLAAGLADAVIRLESPIVAYDRSVLYDVRGLLNLAMLSDPKFPMKETLDTLGQSGFGPANWHFRWREEYGVPVLRTRHFLFYLRGRDLFAQELLAGEFEGSLPELARWINAHQKAPNGEVLMGGEIADGLKRGKISIRSGEMVHEAICEFAKASGVSPYLIVLDMQNPVTGVMLQDPRAWRGAWLQDLTEWQSHPGDERAMGVVPDEPPKEETK